VIQRLCKVGVLSFNQDQAKSLYQSHPPVTPKNDENKKRLKAAQKYWEHLERKERMAFLLIEEEFYEEALVPLKEVLELSLKSFAALMGQTIDEKENVSLDIIQYDFVGKKGFPKEAIQLTQHLQKEITLIDKEKISELAKHIRLITQFLENEINKFILDLAA
jgi:hypothetical protein